jgi:signal transduction histidine kinase
VITITDNGIGIDSDHLEDIFDVFKLLHDGPATEGSGLGLATCRRVVERHGGRIWAESVKGQGSAFYFSIPKS